MSEQLAITGPATPPDLKLGEGQRFSLELLFEKPLSSEDLGSRIHERRRDNGGRGHPRERPCQWCKSEGSSMGSRLRELGLVRFSRKMDVWYTVEKGPPKPEQRIAQNPADDDIPF